MDTILRIQIHSINWYSSYLSRQLKDFEEMLWRSRSQTKLPVFYPPQYTVPTNRLRTLPLFCVYLYGASSEVREKIKDPVLRDGPNPGGDSPGLGWSVVQFEGKCICIVQFQYCNCNIFHGFMTIQVINEKKSVVKIFCFVWQWNYTGSRWTIIKPLWQISKITRHDKNQQHFRPMKGNLLYLLTFC